jgi:pantoate--beta-alanine ligase
MTVYTTRSELSRYRDDLVSRGKSIGLVPTMGALHPGHISLVERSTAENDITVVSVFVNPTQFNDPSDLHKYPRTPGKDLELLRACGADVMFSPSEEEMYPDTEPVTYDLGGLDETMEGALRPGHFDGVAQIVSKLFETIRPHRAYFGQKDFQQLVIIRHFVKLLKLDIQIIDCPIIRERDGLALSSRNVLLTPEQRQFAPFIHHTLVRARELSRTLTPRDVKTWVTLQFEQHPHIELEYFEIVDDNNLKPVKSWRDQTNKVGCIAVRLGETRLIDNIFFD